MAALGDPPAGGEPADGTAAGAAAVAEAWIDDSVRHLRALVRALDGRLLLRRRAEADAAADADAVAAAAPVSAFSGDAPAGAAATAAAVGVEAGAGAASAPEELILRHLQPAGSSPAVATTSPKKKRWRPGWGAADGASCSGGSAAAAAATRVCAAAAHSPSPAAGPKGGLDRATSTTSSSSRNDDDGADAAADAEVDAFVEAERRACQLRGAALTLQAAWRALGPRLRLARFSALRARRRARALQPAWRAWRGWARAFVHHRDRVARAALLEWRQLVVLEAALYRLVVSRLMRAPGVAAAAARAPALRVWALSLPPGAEGFAAGPPPRAPGVGAMLGAMARRQQPLRVARAYLGAWRARTRNAAQRRQLALSCAAARRQARRGAVARAGLLFWSAWAKATRAERGSSGGVGGSGGGAFELPAGLVAPPPGFEEWRARHAAAARDRRRAAELHAVLRARSSLRELLCLLLTRFVVAVGGR